MILSESIPDSDIEKIGYVPVRLQTEPSEKIFMEVIGQRIALVHIVIYTIFVEIINPQLLAKGDPAKPKLVSQ
jgi:hypothetical protein